MAAHGALSRLVVHYNEGQSSMSKTVTLSPACHGAIAFGKYAVDGETPRGLEGMPNAWNRTFQLQPRVGHFPSAPSSLVLNFVCWAQGIREELCRGNDTSDLIPQWEGW